MDRSDLCNWLTRLGLFWAAFFLPLKTTVSNVGIIILIIMSLFSLFTNGYRRRPVRPALFLLATPLALYLPILIGTFYTPALPEAFSQLGKCVFYLLLPGILFRKDLGRKEALRWATWGLVLGCVLAGVFLLGLNLFTFAGSGLPLHRLFGYDFTGKSFLAPLPQLHPVYLGTYIIFMLALLWHGPVKWKPILKGVFTAIGILTILFLNSRMILIISGITIVFMVLKNFPRKLTGLFLLASILLFLLLLPFLKQTYLYTKLTSGLQWELEENVGQYNTDQDTRADSRMSRWMVSLDLIREKPMLGYGTGTSRKLLVNEYKKRNMQASVAQEYDSHNQYLGYAINYGMLGLILLILFFFLNFREAWLQKDAVFLLFFFIIGATCLSENYLIRNMGIDFVALFGSVFYLKKDD